MTHTTALTSLSLPVKKKACRMATRSNFLDLLRDSAAINSMVRELAP
ncbi:hypothetical protein [Mesorhizobium sp. YR577]|nr:hypothetical protein [Mesorhizobium sp. YR577]